MLRGARMEKRPHKATGKPEELVHPRHPAPSQVEGRELQGHCFPQAFRFLGHKVFIAKAGVVTDAGSLAGKLAKASKITSAPMEQFQSQEFIQQILPRVSHEVLDRLLTAACLRQQRLETSLLFRGTGDCLHDVSSMHTTEPQTVGK